MNKENLTAMNRIYLLIICLTMINAKLTMAQSIGLNDLLNFQQQQSPSYIANFLTQAGGWITDHENFQNTKSDYKWFKASAGEQFEPHTKDQISYNSPVPTYKSVIIYVTLTKSNFDAIKATMQSSMTMDATLIDDPKVKMYRYSNANNVIEMIEPFQPQKDSLFMYVFIVYDKQDYDKGFRIK